MKRKFVHCCISLLITALMLWLVFSELSFQDVLSGIINVDSKFFLAYVILSVVALILRAKRYQLILHYMSATSTNTNGSHVPKFSQMLIITAIRNALVDFLPARLGEASYLYVLNRYGVPVIRGVSSFGISLVLDIIVLIMIVAVFAASQGIQSATWIGLGVTVALALLVLLLVTCLLRAERICNGLANWLEKSHSTRKPSAWLSQQCRSLGREVRELSKRGSLVILFVLTLGLRAAKYICLFFVMLSVLKQWDISFADIEPFTTLIAFVGAEAAASLPVSGVMGFGAYEGVWASTFALGCGKACDGISVTGAALLIHVLTQLVGYSIGLIAGLMFLVREWQISIRSIE